MDTSSHATGPGPAAGRDAGDVLDLMCTVVNDVDPLGLIDAGAPVDEYDLEAAALLPLLLEQGRLTGGDVEAVFDFFFWDGAVRASVATELASRLSALMP